MVSGLRRSAFNSVLSPPRTFSPPACGLESTPVCFECGFAVAVVILSLCLYGNLFIQRKRREQLIVCLRPLLRHTVAHLKLNSYRFSVFLDEPAAAPTVPARSVLHMSQSWWIVRREFPLQIDFLVTPVLKCSMFSLDQVFFLLRICTRWKMQRYLCLWAQLCGSPAAVFITHTERDGTQRVTWGDNPKQGYRHATIGFIPLYQSLGKWATESTAQRESCLYQLSLSLVCVQPPLP